MNDPLQSLVRLGVVPAVAFPADSRYYRFTTLQWTGPDGTPITYLARRFVPQPAAPAFATVGRHTVVKADRLDLIAAKYLGDPLLFWAVCDANGTIAPDDLVAVPGRVLVVTAPQGAPGVDTGA